MAGKSNCGIPAEMINIRPERRSDEQFRSEPEQTNQPKPLKLMVMTLIITIFYFAKNAPKSLAGVIRLFIAANIRSRTLTFLESRRP